MLGAMHGAGCLGWSGWARLAAALLAALAAGPTGAEGGDPAPAGHWKPLRPARDGLSPEQRAEAERLEAIGYLQGYRPDARRGVTVYDRARVAPRRQLYSSGHAPVVLLIDLEGRELHRWQVDFEAAFPEHPLGGRPNSQYLRRALALEDGSLLAIFEGIGLVKVDRRSRLLWARAGRQHHDLQVLPDGRIAVLTRVGRLVPRLDPDWPVLEDFVAFLSPEGEELASVSLLEAFAASRAQALVAHRRHGDVFHTNSIEVLGPVPPGLPPAFRPGRILTALNAVGVVALLDAERGRVVWARKLAQVGLHDPSLLANGHLLYFDNNFQPHRSRVVELDPKSGRSVWVHQGSREQPFYSSGLGAASRLPDGHTLITESQGGRAFEVTPDGEIVWEYYNPHRAGEGERLIATVFEMLPLPADYGEGWLSAAGPGGP